MKELGKKVEFIAYKLKLNKSILCSRSMLKELVGRWEQGETATEPLPVWFRGWRATVLVPQLRAVFNEQKRLLDFPPLSQAYL